MRNIYLLLKLMTSNKNNNTLSKLQVIIMSLLSFISIIILSSIFQFYFYKDLKNVGIEVNIIYISLLITFIIIIILSISKIFLDFYYDANILNILVFPIKSIQLIIAKLIILLKTPFIASFAILFVSTLIYGIDKNMKVTYFIFSFLLTIMLPLFIILPILIISILFFYFINKRIYLNLKNSIYTCSLIISILVVFAVKFFDFKILLEDINFNTYSPLLFILGGSKYLLEFILYEPEFILIVKSFLVLFFEILLFYLIFNKFYYKTMLKISMTDQKRYKGKIIRYGEIISLTSIELKSIIRSPFLITNLLLKISFIPISVLLIFFNKDNISLILNLENSTYIKVLFIIIYLLASLNITAITSLSRDKNIYLIEKSFPINIKNKIYSKFIVGFIINIIPILFTILLFTFLFKMNFVYTISIIFYSVLICFSESINCFIKNLKNPFMDYEKEQDLVYSNYNIISLFIRAFVIFFIIIFLTLKFNLSLKFLFIIFILKFIINMLFYKLNENKYIGIFKKYR